MSDAKSRVAPPERQGGTQGPVCHLGTRRCFADGPATAAERLAFLTALERLIEKRIDGRPDGSQTTRLLAEGVQRIAQKVGEQGLELALAGVAENNNKVVAEAADLIFRMLVALKSRGLSSASVIAALAARHTRQLKS